MLSDSVIKRTLMGTFAGCGVLIALLAFQRGQPGSLLPHGYCFVWNAPLLWTHVISDSLIGAAYVTIPLTLLHLVRRRADIPFNWILVLFALFIIGCGSTHWVEVWTVWNPDYWLSAAVKLGTAAASVLTAVALVYLVPRILAIPTVDQLTAAKRALETEVAQRRMVEEELRRERAELERRVRARTQELEEAKAQAEDAHAAAETANRLKDRFLAKVSHELRTPLQSTMGWAHILEQSSHTAPQARQAADRILHNVRSQARLIDDLLDISRILSGKLSLDPQPTEPAVTIDKAVDMVRSTLASRGVTIELNNRVPAGRWLLDPVRLEQVVLNLLNNAVQASAEGCRVRVSAALEADTLHIEVRDWGEGIDPMDLPQLFEPFHQGTSRERGRHRGLGLGLAIAHNIATLFGGELSASSGGPGRGATFALRIPLRTAVTDAEQDAQSQAPHAALAGLRVLYVEDEADIAESGRLILASLGVAVEVARDFASASQRISQGGIDLLLSDLDLDEGPERSGLQLLDLLRAQPRGEQIPAIVLSAYGSAEDRRRTQVRGFRAHLVKPVDAAALADALRSAVVA